MGEKKYHGEPHHTLKKTISKTGLALKRVNLLSFFFFFCFFFFFLSLESRVFVFPQQLLTTIMENLPKHAWILCVRHNLLLAELCALRARCLLFQMLSIIVSTPSGSFKADRLYLFLAIIQ